MNEQMKQKNREIIWRAIHQTMIQAQMLDSQRRWEEEQANMDPIEREIMGAIAEEFKADLDQELLVMQAKSEGTVE